MTTLYELTKELQELEDYLIETGGELTDDLENRMNLVHSDIAKKLEGYCYIIRNLETYSEGCKAEISRLRGKKGVADRSIERLKERILFHADTLKQAGLFKLTVRNTKSVEVSDFEELPQEFKRVKLEPDKVKIGAELKAGVAVPGASLIEKKSLTIK